MFSEQTPHCSPDKASEETSPGFSNNPKVLEMAVLKQWVNPGGRCDFFFIYNISILKVVSPQVTSLCCLTIFKQSLVKQPKYFFFKFFFYDNSLNNNLCHVLRNSELTSSSGLALFTDMIGHKVILCFMSRFSHQLIQFALPSFYLLTLSFNYFLFQYADASIRLLQHLRLSDFIFDITIFLAINFTTHIICHLNL